MSQPTSQCVDCARTVTEVLNFRQLSPPSALLTQHDAHRQASPVIASTFLFLLSRFVRYTASLSRNSHHILFGLK